MLVLAADEAAWRLCPERTSPGSKGAPVSFDAARDLRRPRHASDTSHRQRQNSTHHLPGSAMATIIIHNDISEPNRKRFFGKRGHKPSWVSAARSSFQTTKDQTLPMEGSNLP
ncbi:MAG: hypothetical protein ACJAVR_004152 [Paracoccaceae bacterium]|jgi:hypothetical protein